MCTTYIIHSYIIQSVHRLPLHGSLYNYTMMSAPSSPSVPKQSLRALRRYIGYTAQDQSADRVTHIRNNMYLALFYIIWSSGQILGSTEQKPAISGAFIISTDEKKRTARQDEEERDLFYSSTMSPMLICLIPDGEWSGSWRGMSIYSTCGRPSVDVLYNTTSPVLLYNFESRAHYFDDFYSTKRPFSFNCLL